MTNQEIGRSLASSFVEMAQALDLLPKVEADLNDAKSRIDFLNSRIAFLESHNTELGDKVVELEAKYADATKSATGHKSNVELLLDEARKAIENLTAVVEIVSPRPKPEVALPNPLATIGQSAPTTGEATSPNPTAVGGDSEQQAVVTVNQPPFADLTSSPGNDPSTVTGDTTPTTSGQSEENPTSSSVTTTQGLPAQVPSVSGQESVNSTDRQGSNPKPYWLKPSNMTWADWAVNGGDVPSWADDSEEIMNLIR